MNKLVVIIESFILAVFFGLLPVVICFVTAGLANVIFLEEKGITYWALAGLVVGLFIDIIFVKSWVKKAYQINSRIMVALYVFYSIGVFGLCMGIPVLNFVLCMAAGAYTARRIYHNKAGPAEFEPAVRKVSVFAAAVMAMICFLMALWAGIGGMIGYRFETPFLSFTFTIPVFFIIVLTGGALLVLLQYYLTRISAKATFKLSTLNSVR